MRTHAPQQLDREPQAAEQIGDAADEQHDRAAQVLVL
jgi:hypothetical protein